MYKKIFDFSKLIGEIDILIFCNPAPLSVNLPEGVFCEMLGGGVLAGH